MAKWRDNEAPASWTVLVSAPHVLPGASLLSWHCDARTPGCDQPVANSSPSTRESGTSAHKSRKLRAVGSGVAHGADHDPDHFSGRCTVRSPVTAQAFDQH